MNPIYWGAIFYRGVVDKLYTGMGLDVLSVGGGRVLLVGLMSDNK